MISPLPGPRTRIKPIASMGAGMANYYHARDRLLSPDVTRLFQEVDVLVDVGAGIRPTTLIPSKVHICIEPWREYMEILMGCHPGDATYVFIQNDAILAMKNFPDNSVDTVCMLDLIEHLEKEDGLELLREADRIAKKQIIIFTPLGFVPNHTDGVDVWGLGGMKMQERRTGWLPEDFTGNGWDFHICENFHQKNDRVDRDFGAFWAIKTKDIKIGIHPKTPKSVMEFVENYEKNKRKKHSIFTKIKKYFRSRKNVV